MFSWTEAKYTEVTTGVTGNEWYQLYLKTATDYSLLLVLTSLSSLLVLPLLSYRLEVPDFAIGILASLSLVSASVGTAFSRTGTHYIIGKPGGEK